jgi:hypothetical protein
VRYRPSNTHESVWRGKEQRIFLTLFVFSSAARPASALPALLLTIVRSFAEWPINASTSSEGMPALPKPPIRIVAPSRMSATAASND